MTVVKNSIPSMVDVSETDQDAAEASVIRGALNREIKMVRDGNIPAVGMGTQTQVKTAPQPEPSRPAPAPPKKEERLPVPVPAPRTQVGEQTLFRLDDGKNAVAARHAVYSDGSTKPLEEWRDPTDDEIKTLPLGHYLAGGPADEEAEEPPSRLKWAAIGALGGAALVGLGLFAASRMGTTEYVEDDEEIEVDPEAEAE